MTEQIHKRRREIIGRLEYDYQQAQAKHLKAEEDAAQAELQMTKIETALLRAKVPQSHVNICIECWIIHGRESDLYAVPHEDPSHYDRMKCKICGYVQDTKIGL